MMLLEVSPCRCLNLRTCGWDVSKNRQMVLIGIIRLEVRRWILRNQLSLGVPLEPFFVVNKFFARICVQIGKILKSLSYQLHLSYLQHCLVNLIKLFIMYLQDLSWSW